MDVQKIVFNYFQEKGIGIDSGRTEDEILNCYYLDEGLIDSMGIVEMIIGFEEKFNIHFEADHLQSIDFQTVGGLIRLVLNIRSENK